MPATNLISECWGDDANLNKVICYGEKGKAPNKECWCSNIYEVYKFLDELQLSGKRYNVYYCPAIFKTERQKRNKNNVDSLNCLWIDLDLKLLSEKDDLKSLALQLNKLSNTIFANNFWLVFTGHGFHAYWFLDRRLSTDAWLLCANYLKKIVKDLAIKADINITSDSARMLRLPGTLNVKDDNPKTTKIVKRSPIKLSADKLLDLAKNAGINIPQKKIKAEKNTNADVADILANDFPPADAVLVAEQCAFIKQFSIDGFNENEPAWNAAVNAIRLCENGEEIIHEFSAKSGQYSEEETNQKITAKDRSNVKPTTCLHAEQFGFCDNCEFKSKITSPIQLGAITTKLENKLTGIDKKKERTRAQECVTYYPREPWQVGKEGIFLKEDGVLNLVCNVPFFIIDLLAEDFNDSTILTAIIHALSKNKPTTFKLPLKYLADTKKLIGEFNSRKIFPSSTKYLIAYIKKYISNLELNNVKPQIAVNSLGWLPDGSFVYNSKGKAIAPDNVQYNYIFDSKVNNYVSGFAQKGNLDSWHEIFNVYKDDVYIPHLFSLLCSIGTPLLSLTSAKGIVLSLCACSGAGKTLAHKVAMAAWGDPDAAGILGTKDTHTAIVGRAAAIKNLPLRLDEITNLDPKLLSGLVYELVNGKGRARATMDGSLSSTSNFWQTLTLVTTNSALLDQDFKILSEAERNRVLELHVSMPKNIVKDARVLSNVMVNNYGILGVEFLKDVVKNKDEWVNFLEKMQTALSMHVDSSKRFWVSCGAIAFAAMRFCLRKGFEIDKQKILTWFTNFLKESEEDNAINLRELRGFTNLEEMAYALRDSLEGSIKVLNIDGSVSQTPNKPVQAYIVRKIDYDILHVRPVDLKNFLKKHYQTTFKSIRKELGIEDSATYRFSDVVVRSYKFKLSKSVDN